jgi:ubiquinone/menaquinone biosynthesis C-methylase UbiE
MPSEQRSVQAERFLGKSDVHEKWHSDYLNPDLDRFYDTAFADILRILKPQPGSKILDAGCGYGYHTVRLARGLSAITAVDFSGVALEAARRTFAIAGISDQINLEQADLTALPFAEATFDFVVSWGVIMHVPDMERALSELARVLKPGGILVLCENNVHSFDVMVRERLLRMVKLVLGKPVPDLRQTPRGTEAWAAHQDGGLMVRKTDFRFLSDFLKGRGLAQFRRQAGQFTEAYTNVKMRWAKRMAYAFNAFYYRHVGIAQFAMGNIIYFRKS